MERDSDLLEQLMESIRRGTDEEVTRLRIAIRDATSLEDIRDTITQAAQTTARNSAHQADSNSNGNDSGSGNDSGNDNGNGNGNGDGNGNGNGGNSSSGSGSGSTSANSNPSPGNDDSSGRETLIETLSRFRDQRRQD